MILAAAVGGETRFESTTKVVSGSVLQLLLPVRAQMISLYSDDE
jgi:hypothetical protein